MPQKTGIIYFSPTGTTEKICRAIVSGMKGNSVRFVNVTLPEKRSGLIASPAHFTEDLGHLIIGAPVYAGKIPLQVIDSLNVLNGQGKTCTVVAVYGNRDYGIALKQMIEIATRKGFLVTSAGAFIGQHSYSDVIPVAMGRPDYKDVEIAIDFGRRIQSLKQPLAFEDIPVQLDMFSKSKKYSPLIPVFISSRCTHCSICSRHCPTGIISPETGDFLSKAEKKECIGCMACVKSCRYEARRAHPNIVMKFLIRKILKKASYIRTEPLTIPAE